jgi:hypothetical protein
MKGHATELGIHLLFISLGLADETQPLDRLVFDVMKVHGRQMYRNDAAALGQRNKQTAAAFLARAWETVSTAVLDEAWP